MKKAKLSVLLIFVVLVSCCNPKKNSCETTMDNELFAYDLNNPDANYKLPSYLEEISGISYYGNNKIACIQDEKAVIYIVSLKENKIITEYNFGEDADYEDIAIIDSTAYILRNDGQIFMVDNFKEQDRSVKSFNTPLREKNNTEGMAFDALSNSLLIACKGSPSIENENMYKGYKAVYTFDIEKGKLNTTPHFLIDLERLDSYSDHNGFTKLSVKTAKRLHLIESEANFKPSGIAIHPFSSQIYIISSVGKLLTIMSNRGEILDVRELDSTIFRQPEGISFSPAGDLFISNEGQGGKGYILKFQYHADK